MPPTIQYLSTKLAEFGAAFLTLGLYLAIAGMPQSVTLGNTLALAALIVIAFLSARWLMRKYVPAKCPKCGGPAYCRGFMPVRFVCTRCQHIHHTRFHEGGDTTS